MEIPSSDEIHRLTVEEFDTTKLLAHAARQARQRKYSEFMIVLPPVQLRKTIIMFLSTS